MKKQLKSIVSMVNKNKLPFIAALAAIAIVGVPTYAQRQAQVRKQEAAKVEVAKDEVKPQEVEAEPVVEEPKAEEPAPVAVAPKTQTTTTKKTETQTYTKPKENTTTVEQVSMSLSRSGDSVVALIGTSKAGTCYFTFKDYTDPNNLKYSEVSSPAANGGCSVAVPAGSFTHVKASYKASDYSAKGYSEKIAL